MLKALKLRGVRGHDVEYAFHPAGNRILGRNRAGKTTIRDAIAFALAGTDAAGNRAPTHLISWGADRLEVEVMTSQAVIGRTLTAKKNGTLRLERAGVVSALSQEQMSALVGPPDVFLSIFSVGYFFTLTPERKKAVLAYVLPKEDPLRVLEELCQVQFSPDDLITHMDLSRRADLVAGALAIERRKLTSLYDQNMGKVAALRGAAAPGERPVEPVKSSFLSNWEALRDAWQLYTVTRSSWEGRTRAAADAAAANSSLEAHRAQLEAERQSLQMIMNVPELKAEASARSEALTQLRRELKPIPAEPPQAALPDTPNCPTCGQTVGSKHRARVMEEAERRYEAWKAEVDQTRQWNAAVQAKIQAAEEAYGTAARAVAEAEAANSRTARRHDEIERLLKTLQPQPWPVKDPGPEPQRPEAEYNAAAHHEAKAAKEQYQRELAQWEFATRQHAAAADEVARIEQQSAPLQAAAARLKLVEANLGRLPEEMLRRQAAQLAMNNYRLEVGDDVRIFTESGTPWEAMSTGEAMRAALAFSVKLDELAPRKIRMHFIDNADLIDNQDYFQLEGRQIFVALVDESASGVTILPQ